jgi:drug/metabolite transporter (DMT)-like permease
MCISASAVLFILANVGPVTAAFYRCALPLPGLAALAVSERRREGPRTTASHGYALMAGFFLALNLVFWIHTIADVGAGAATVLGNLQALFIAFLAWTVLDERPNWLLMAMLPVVLVGVILVSGIIGGRGTAQHPLAGVLLRLATSATYACFLLILRQTAGKSRHAAGQLFDATAGAAVSALLLGLTFGGLQLAIPWQSLGWLVVLTLTNGIIGWLLITRSLPHLPATVSALILLLESAGAMILGALALGQRPSAFQLTGAVVVCSGVLTVAVGQARTERHDPPLRINEAGSSQLFGQPLVGPIPGVEPSGGESCGAVGRRVSTGLDGRERNAITGDEGELSDASIVVVRNDLLIPPGHHVIGPPVKELGGVDDEVLRLELLSLVSEHCHRVSGLGFGSVPGGRQPLEFKCVPLVVLDDDGVIRARDFGRHFASSFRDWDLS